MQNLCKYVENGADVGLSHSPGWGLIPNRKLASLVVEHILKRQVSLRSADPLVVKPLSTRESRVTHLTIASNSSHSLVEHVL